MKYRVLDVMNEALGLVKKSDLGGATALIRKALSGETAPEGEAAIRKRPLPVHRRKSFRCPAPPVGRNPARPARPADHAARLRPTRPNPRQRRISANGS